jgi:hypothetical protein
LFIDKKNGTLRGGTPGKIYICAAEDGQMGSWAVFGKLFDGRMKGKMKISITCEKVGPFLMILFSWNIY